MEFGLRQQLTTPRQSQACALAQQRLGRTSNWMSSLMVAMNSARMSCSRCRSCASFLRKSTVRRLNVRHPNSMIVWMISTYAGAGFQDGRCARARGHVARHRVSSYERSDLRVSGTTAQRQSRIDHEYLNPRRKREVSAGESIAIRKYKHTQGGCALRPRAAHQDDDLEAGDEAQHDEAAPEVLVLLGYQVEEDPRQDQGVQDARREQLEHVLGDDAAQHEEHEEQRRDLRSSDYRVCRQDHAHVLQMQMACIGARVMFVLIVLWKGLQPVTQRVTVSGLHAGSIEGAEPEMRLQKEAQRRTPSATEMCRDSSMAPAGRLTDQAQYPTTRPKSRNDRSTSRYDVRGSESRNVLQLSWNGVPSC